MDQQSKEANRHYKTGSPSPSATAANTGREKLQTRDAKDTKNSNYKEADSVAHTGVALRNNLTSPELSVNTSHHGSSSKLLPAVTNLPEEREFFAAVKNQLISRVGEKVRDTESMLKGSFSKLETREKEIIKHYESQLSTSRQITNHLVNLSLIVGIPVVAKNLTRREEGLISVAQKHYISKLLIKGVKALDEYASKRRDYKLQSEQNQVLATLSQDYNQHIDKLESEIAELKKEIIRTKKEKMRFKDTVRAALESGFSLLESSGKKAEDQSEFEEEHPRTVTPTEFIATSAYSSNYAENKAQNTKDYQSAHQSVTIDRKPGSTHNSQADHSQSQHSASQSRYKRSQGPPK
jgi:uncharacterized small protein (DUF1192 family)